MGNIYGVSLRQFLSTQSYGCLVRLVTKGVDKQEIFSGFIGEILREHGPDWMEGMLERHDLQLYLNRSATLGKISDVLLGFDVLPSQQPFPEAFRRVADWHELTTAQRARENDEKS